MEYSDCEYVKSLIDERIRFHLQDAAHASAEHAHPEYVSREEAEAVAEEATAVALDAAEVALEAAETAVEAVGELDLEEEAEEPETAPERLEEPEPETVPLRQHFLHKRLGG